MRQYNSRMHEATPDRKDYLVLPPLSEQQREAYPAIIYEHVRNSAVDDASLLIALTVTQNIGLPFIADRAAVVLHHQPKERSVTAERNLIRSTATDRCKTSAQSALIVGTKAVANHALGTEKASVEIAQERAESALRQITDNPDLAEVFQEYYGGLRWGSDEEMF